MTAAAAETIFALSSGPTPAAIAVVRVSGPAAAAVLHGLAGRVPGPRRATAARLTKSGGEVLDEALLLWLPGPASATGEDVAELHLHGGRATVAAVLAALTAMPGCRAALPGEFTRRAFLNGRIDLAQAEGLADLLAAETESQRRQAMRAAAGGLGRLVEEWRQRTLVLSARIEAQIEFADEQEVAPDPAFAADLAALAAELREALRQPPAERLRDGVRVVVAGPPNAGKSTLVNALAGRKVAITGPTPGTTRDLLEAPTTFGGAPLIFVDSAGLRDTDDPVERQGVALARGAADEADVLLWLGTAADRPPVPNVIEVRAKADLDLVEEQPKDGAVSVSAVTGYNMAALRSRLEHAVRECLPGPDQVALNGRQRATIATALDAAETAAVLGEIELVAHALHRVRTAFDLLVGRAQVEDMLDALFGRFCLGK